MLDINQWTVAGKVTEVELNEGGKVAKATLYVATNDTPPTYQGQQPPKAKWTKHRIIFFGSDAYAVKRLQRGTSIVASGVFTHYEGTMQNGQSFESFQTVGRRFWTPGTVQQQEANPPPPPEPEPQQQAQKQDDFEDDIPF